MRYCYLRVICCFFKNYEHDDQDEQERIDQHIGQYESQLDGSQRIFLSSMDLVQQRAPESDCKKQLGAWDGNMTNQK